MKVPILSKTLPPYLHVTSIAMPTVHMEGLMVSLTAALAVLCLAHVRYDETELLYFYGVFARYSFR